MCLKPDCQPVLSLPNAMQRKIAKQPIAASKKPTRNSEKRKAKSRDAARCRRSKESEIFSSLAETIPLPHAAVSHLDKTSILRLCMAYLRTRSIADNISAKDETILGNDSLAIVECEAELMLKALRGFIMILTTDGEIAYASDNISVVLGISQVDSMGQTILDYAHPCDHEELKGFMSPKEEIHRHAFIRIKSTISSKGRSLNLRSASYKVVEMRGKKWTHGGTEPAEGCVVAVAVPVPHPSNQDIPLTSHTFISKHSLDMKYIYVDHSIERFCQFKPKHLVGKSVFEMCHVQDCNLLKTSYKNLFAKGQVETCRYRLLAREGGFVWVVTQATLIVNSKDTKPQYVICLNYVVSGIASPGSIVSDVQLETKLKETDVKQDIPSSLPIERSAPKPQCPPRCMPVAATSSLLRDKPKDLHAGFLTFNNNDPNKAVLKEEPEDLTHLAPSGGDRCLPLDFPQILEQDWDDLLPVTELNDVADLLEFVSGDSSCCELLQDDSCSQLSPNHAKSFSPYDDCANVVDSKNGLNDHLQPGTVFAAKSPLWSQASHANVKSEQPLLNAAEKSPRDQFVRTGKSIRRNTMDQFGGFGNVKREDVIEAEDLELRSPYISPMEMLVFGADDWVSLPTPQDQALQSSELDRLDDGDLEDNQMQNAKNAPLFRKISPLLRSNSPLHNSKINGSRCVDPNQVLAVQLPSDDESDHGTEELKHLLQMPIATKQKCLQAHTADHNASYKMQARPDHPYPHKRSVAQQDAYPYKKVRKNDPTPIFAPVMQHLLNPHNASTCASLEALAKLPVNQDGKVELTKQQLSTLLGSAGIRYVPTSDRNLSARYLTDTNQLTASPTSPELDYFDDIS